MHGFVRHYQDLMYEVCYKHGSPLARSIATLPEWNTFPSHAPTGNNQWTL